MPSFISKVGSGWKALPWKQIGIAGAYVVVTEALPAAVQLAGGYYPAGTKDANGADISGLPRFDMSGPIPDAIGGIIGASVAFGMGHNIAGSAIIGTKFLKQTIQVINPLWANLTGTPWVLPISKSNVIHTGVSDTVDAYRDLPQSFENRRIVDGQGNESIVKVIKQLPSEGMADFTKAPFLNDDNSGNYDDPNGVINRVSEGMADYAKKPFGVNDYAKKPFGVADFSKAPFLNDDSDNEMSFQDFQDAVAAGQFV